MTDVEVATAFDQVCRTYMIEDIRKGIDLGTANCLVALGLLSYLEVLGGLITGDGARGWEFCWEELQRSSGPFATRLQTARRNAHGNASRRQGAEGNLCSVSLRACTRVRPERPGNCH